MEKQTAEVDFNDIALICLVLDRVIKQRTQEERTLVDRTIGTAVPEIVGMVVAFDGHQIDELVELHGRLEAMLPRSFFFFEGGE